MLTGWSQQRTIPNRSSAPSSGRWPRQLLFLCPLIVVWVGLQFLLYVRAEHFQKKPDENERLLSAPNHILLPILSGNVTYDEAEIMNSPIPTPPPLPTVVAPAPPARSFSKSEEFEMEFNFLMYEKDWPYVGSVKYRNKFDRASRHHYNSLAVFPNQNETRMHGLVGIFPNGSRKWQPAPMPPPIDKIPGGKDAGLKFGGFYMNLSDALPVDRDPSDGRDAVCLKENYDLRTLEDVSVIITFYNEGLSTLLRSVHSVLNYTPPPILNELILVDDHSNNTDAEPGGYLYDYVRLLPKVKLVRLGERRGLVWARLVGAKLAKAPVLVVLDSHIEVNAGWLEPQLARLRDSPTSIVFPQIPSIAPETFDYLNAQGIGCFLTFKWIMQEKASLTGKLSKPDPIPSASMAGGLFAVRKEWFWELGGYDEEFGMWGAENVEMGFRTWMCGGRMECTPCARVYHIYRKGGHAYKSPPESLWKNRLRTARIWTDEFYQLAQRFTHHPGFDIGPLDHMLELKERLHCKDFKWFLANVDPGHKIQKMEDVQVMGELRSLGEYKNICIDTLSNNKPGGAWGYFHCHGGGGTQGFLMLKDEGRIHSFTDEYRCLGNDFKLTDCQANGRDNYWSLEGDGTLRWKASEAGERCMTVVITGGQAKFELADCSHGNQNQKWSYTRFSPDPDFKLPEFSDEYKKRRAERSADRADFAAEVVDRSSDSSLLTIQKQLDEEVSRRMSLESLLQGETSRIETEKSKAQEEAALRRHEAEEYEQAIIRVLEERDRIQSELLAAQQALRGPRQTPVAQSEVGFEKLRASQEEYERNMLAVEAEQEAAENRHAMGEEAAGLAQDEAQENVDVEVVALEQNLEEDNGQDADGVFPIPLEAEAPQVLMEDDVLPDEAVMPEAVQVDAMLPLPEEAGAPAPQEVDAAPPNEGLAEAQRFEVNEGEVENVPNF